MEDWETALVVVIILIVIWFFYQKTKKEGIDVRALARPISGGYSSESKLLGRSWTTS